MRAQSGERLRIQRQASGLTLRQAAEATGFSLSHLSNVERGERAASEQFVRAYAHLSDAAQRETPPTRAPSVTDEGSYAPIAGDDDFGTRLLRLRLSRGQSLSELSAATYVSKPHLGNLERGRKRPSPAVAAACDRELVAGGALIALALAPRRPDASRVPIPAPSDYRIDEASARRDEDGADADKALASGESALLTLRHAAQREQPQQLAHELALRAHLTASVAERCGAFRSKPLWLLAARCAEFIGWLAEEAGQTAVSYAWTDTAVRWAAAGGDRDMAGYRWERLALTALYRGDGNETVALAQRALAERGISARIRGLATRRLAQGHALAGDRLASERALDEAVGLLARGPTPYPGGPSWGPNSIDDASGLIRASCLVDLGAHRSAAVIFGREAERWAPPGAVRTRVRFILRGALAFAGMRELDHACALTESALPDMRRIDSETIRADVRRLTGMLIRYMAHRQVRQLLPELILVTRGH